LKTIVNDGFNARKFDILISRATFKLSELLSQGEFFLAPDGKIIALKGLPVEEEIQQCSLVKINIKYSNLFNMI